MTDNRFRLTWKKAVALVCSCAFLLFAQGSVSAALAANEWETWPKKPVEAGVEKPAPPAETAPAAGGAANGGAAAAGAANAGAAGGAKASAGLSAGTIALILLGVGGLIAIGVAAGGGGGGGGGGGTTTTPAHP